MNNYKKGAGNKMQPYVPKGNGEKSGEYTNKDVFFNNCLITNKKCLFNFFNSKLVKKVDNTFVCDQGTNVPRYHKPNSVCKKIIKNYIVSERYYNDYGEAYLDIDYTNHGNASTHPFVPHVHIWKRDLNGKLFRDGCEKFK